MASLGAAAFHGYLKPEYYLQKNTWRDREQMARRRRNETLLEAALSGGWPVSAVLAVGCLVLGYFVLPMVLSGSPLLAPAANVARKAMMFFAMVFGVIALVKFLFEVLNREPELDLGTESQTPNRLTIDPKKMRNGPAARRSQPVYTPPPSYASSVTPQHPKQKPTEWSLGLLQDIEWKRFEDLCALFYREMGFQAETTPLGPDGGVDIRLSKEEDGRLVKSIVQCKAWGERWVGVKPIRELLGVMAHEKIEKAFFMAPGGYSDDARKFAEANRITLLDGKVFLAMLKRLPSVSSAKLLEFATSGDYTTPTCPSCGVTMVKRTGRKGDFWGCSTFPKCRQRLYMRSQTA